MDEIQKNPLMNYLEIKKISTIYDPNEVVINLILSFILNSTEYPILNLISMIFIYLSSF